jgi:hypothetical protein
MVISMSVVGDNFVRAFGAPDPVVSDGLRFTRRLTRELWSEIHAEIGAGWFADGFLYLFADGVEDLMACLEAWSFLMPENANRVALGRNAHGAILVLENEVTPMERVYLLDPFTVSYTEVPNTRFNSLFGRTLPRAELGEHFHDDRVYRAWRERHGVRRLERDQILGFQVPRGLGGARHVDNVRLENAVAYYRSTAPAYTDAFAQARSSSGSS